MTGGITNGNVSASNTYNYGSVVKYECAEGYQISKGKPRNYCQGKNWKHGDTKPTCTGKSTAYLAMSLVPSARGTLGSTDTSTLLALVSLQLSSVVLSLVSTASGTFGIIETPSLLAPVSLLLSVVLSPVPTARGTFGSTDTPSLLPLVSLLLPVVLSLVLSARGKLGSTDT